MYVEKPISHTIDEGKAMVKAAREADRSSKSDCTAASLRILSRACNF